MARGNGIEKKGKTQGTINATGASVGIQKGG